MYSEQSVQLRPGDMILAFSDGATEVQSPGGEQLTPRGFLRLAEATLAKFVGLCGFRICQRLCWKACNFIGEGRSWMTM